MGLERARGQGAVLRVESVGIELPLDELYAGLDQLPPEVPSAKRLPRPKLGS